jgi:hypothetical protein
MIVSLRKRGRTTAVAAVVAVAAAASVLLASCSTATPFMAVSRGPHRHLEPQEVVQIQIALLSDTEHPGRGETVAYQFQSPDAPGAWAGDSETAADYRKLLGAPAFRPLRTAFDIRYKPVIRMGTVAIQRVRVSSTDGVDAVYDFRLRRQTDGECADCWLVLSIRPVEIIPRVEPLRPKSA